MTRVLALTAILLAAAAVSSAQAQGYPTQPITIVVPTSPGGPPDTLARLLAEPMRASLGQPVVVENVTGAGGTSGRHPRRRAPRPTATRSASATSTRTSSAARSTTAYDLLNDLEPVALLVTAPMVFVTRQALPVKDMRGAGGMAEGQSGQGDVRLGRRRRARACLGARLSSEPPASASSSCRIAARCWWCRTCWRDTSTSAAWRARTSSAHLRGDKIRALRRSVRQALVCRAGRADHRRDRRARPADAVLARACGRRRARRPMSIARLNGAVEALADPTVRARLADLGQEVVPREHADAGGHWPRTTRRKSKNGRRSSRPPGIKAE